MASKTYNTINSYISQYNNIANTLGLGTYSGLLSQKVTTNVTKTVDDKSSTPIVHSDDNVSNTFNDIIGVYYFNYDNIINTLNRNIGGSSFMNQGYDITDEGSNLGQRENIIFGNENRPQPLFLSDKERDSYSNYINYMTENYGVLSYEDPNVLAEGSSGYSISVRREFEIGDNINANGKDDTVLGHLSTMALSNIVDTRNNIRKDRGFPSITNISYYDKGRTDIENSDGILSLDTAIGISSDENLPNFGIKKDYAFIGFGNTTLEYSYSSSTQNYSLFDRWGELTNSNIAFNSSPAYNSLKKSATYNTDEGTLYMSADKTIDMSRFVVRNMKYKNGYNSDESITTYFGFHGFDAVIEDTTAKNRYLIYTHSMPEMVTKHGVSFHYDEGKLNNQYRTANEGTNHGVYILGDSITGAYGKDLTYVTHNAFKNNKYKTIISKFATQQNDNTDKHEPLQTAVSNQFGMSHGRNLLKVKYQNGTPVVDTSGGNGYDNPYCRVWTYHHQYHKLCDSIRPFTQYDASDNEECSYDDLSRKRDIAKYRNTLVLSNTEFYSDGTNKKKVVDIMNSEGLDLLKNHGVRNLANGLINITPTGSEDGEEKVKVKNCMFSIENLAWKDVNKVKSQLSKEQTGPFGGRIMWFPPYGLTFSENVSTNWNSLSFIGRGENVYTYSNTERSGNLSFIMLIDHPSIINEWRNEDKSETGQDVDDVDSTEQKILRFFAGCQLLDNFTPKEPEKKPEPKPEPQPEPKVPHTGQFSFIVYYPNNYSGEDDTPEQTLSYLLNGVLYGEALHEDTYPDYKLGYDILDYQYINDAGTSDAFYGFSETEVKTILQQINTTTDANLTNYKANGGDTNPFETLSAYETGVKEYNSNNYTERAKSRCYLFYDYLVSVGAEEDLSDSTKSTTLKSMCGTSGGYHVTDTDIENIWNYINNDAELKEFIAGEYDDIKVDSFDTWLKEKFPDKYISLYDEVLPYYNVLSKPIKLGVTYDKLYDGGVDLLTSSYASLGQTQELLNLLSEASEYRDTSAYTASETSLILVPNKYPNNTEYFLIPYEAFMYIMQWVKDSYSHLEPSTSSPYDALSAYTLFVGTHSSPSGLKKDDYKTSDKMSPSVHGADGAKTYGYEMHGDSGDTSFGVSTEALKEPTFYADAVTAGNMEKHDETFKEGDKNVIYTREIGIVEKNGMHKKKFFAPWNKTVYGGADLYYKDLNHKGKIIHKHYTDYEHSWGYRVDKKTYDQVLIKQPGKYNNYIDGISYGLNAKGYARQEAKDRFKSFWENPVYSFADAFAAIMPQYKDSNALKDFIIEDNVKDIQTYLSYGITKVDVYGSASQQGEYKGVSLNSGKNDKSNTENDNLTDHRATTVQQWLKDTLKQDQEIEYSEISRIPRGTPISGNSISSLDMKTERYAVVTIHYDETVSWNARDALTEYGSASGNAYGYYDISGNTQLNYRDGVVDESNENVTLDEVTVTGSTTGYTTIRYDNEAEFFKTLHVTDPFLHHRIKDKIKYFDPAFHSITPEGFGARLTFLQQCTRQGNTISASDPNRKTATNLAFGRPPVCVLRIGDFYYTKIIINSLNISYENGSGIQWDLNPEGIGVMPMYAKIDISFKFIGGSDLEGPISRLQNALSFNYYANTRVYDNRSDKVEYNYVDEGNDSNDKPINDGSIKSITPWIPEMS